MRTTLQAYGIPLDADVVLAFGRAAPIKGFERLIPALAPLRDRIHFVLISVPYINDDSQQQIYDQLLQQHAIRATHIKAFTRDLPPALCQWPRTKMVVVPSRHETFSNIPLEVALWARENGPVVVASSVGGFVDQIEAGVTGFFIDISSLSAHDPDAAPRARSVSRRTRGDSASGVSASHPCLRLRAELSGHSALVLAEGTPESELPSALKLTVT